MKVLRFMLDHKLSLLVAIVLLFVLANCELALPSTMRDIIDTGISSSGITSVVPDTMTSQRYEQLSMFLSPSERGKVEAAYTPSDGYVTFTGTEEQRKELEGILPGVETLLYRFDQGVDVVQFVTGLSGSWGGYISDDLFRMLDTQIGDTVYTYEVVDLVQSGMIKNNLLFHDRADLMSALGDTGTADISSRAIEFVKTAYTERGVDLSSLQRSYLIKKGLMMLVYVLLSAFCAFASTLNAARTAAVVARDLRHDLYERVLTFSPREMDQFSVASLITRATNDIQQIQTMLALFLRTVLLSPCLGLCALYRIIIRGYTGLQWVLVAGIIAIGAIVGVLMGLTVPKFRRMQSYVDRNNLIAREILTGIVPIRAFGRTRYEEQRYDEANSELTRTYIFTNRVMSFMMPAMLVVMNVASVLIIWFGAQGVSDGTMRFGDLVAYMNYTALVIRSFMVLTMIAVTLPRADVAADRVREVLDTYTSIFDPVEYEELMGETEEEQAADDSADSDDEWHGIVTFDDVSFTYPGADIPALEHISFTARPGETLGIIGLTGAGKTTLVQLIMRLYDATEGSVSVDGIDVREIGLEELRGLVGYAPQKLMLFSGTIASNIKYSDPSMPDEQMVSAAEVAQAMEFIDSKDDGFQSPISQGGSNVSGGQRQRLSIARALATRAKILVFDDSFSALDYKTDASLRHALSEYAKGSTVVLVAQRITNVMNAQQILVLDEGRVAGLGTHEELLHSCAVYREIAMSQLSADELGIDSDSAVTEAGEVTDVC